MVQELIGITPELGELISEVVRHFAHQLGLGPGDYDLWYHDEPVWIVRSRQQYHHDYFVGSYSVRRVQICAFQINAEAKLTFVPDAYLYDPVKKAVLKRSSARSRRENCRTLSLGDLVEGARWGKSAHVKSQVDKTLRETWDLAHKVEL